MRLPKQVSFGARKRPAAVPGFVRSARTTGRSAFEHLKPASPAGARGVTGRPTRRSGVEDPRDLAGTIPLVERAFAFVDLCGFTHFMAHHVEHEAIMRSVRSER